MATQLITVAKVGGIAGEFILQRLQEWFDARLVSDSNEWSSEQWSPLIREQVDRFACQLRANAAQPPVISFVEWIDQWSMFDVFDRLLKPSNGLPLLQIHGNEFQLYGYRLPDNGQLARNVAKAHSRHESAEERQFRRHLRNVIETWQRFSEVRSALIVLRRVTGGLVTDEEIEASFQSVPDWLVD